MHEWSVAQAVVVTLSHKFPDRKIKRVVVGIPKFSFLDLEVLQQAFDVLKQESNLQDAKLEVRIKEPVMKCRSCGRSFTLAEVMSKIESLKGEYGEEYPLHLMPELLPSFISCPYCGSHDVEVMGQEITIDEVE
jgi:hydrogenase nickel incorporation protein HypA/HybF